MSLTHTRVQRLAVLACMSALAFVLMLFEFPVIPVVSYLKMDFSDLPVLIATWLYGPVAGIIVAAIKCLLHGLMYGMSVGELLGVLSNLLSSMSLLLPFAWFLRRGKGSLKRSFELLKQKLTVEGLFNSERKRPLPQYPQRVAVISSTKAAGYADFMKISSERWGGVKFVVANVNVQGVNAADQAVRAISYFNQMSESPDVIVLIRGGGSAEDLASFNDEKLVRAVASSRIPTMTGIGHEIDESLCDLAADVRAATPSNAAQLLFPDKREVIRHLHYRLIDAKDSICRAIEEQSLNATMLQKEALKQWSSRVDMAANATLSQQKVIAEYDPEMALRRGYAMIKGDLQIGNIVEITTKDIIMKARIENSEQRYDN